MASRFEDAREWRMLLILLATSVLSESRYLMNHVNPNDCDATSYFDAVSFNCVKCGAHSGQENSQVASSNGGFFVAFYVPL